VLHRSIFDDVFLPQSSNCCFLRSWLSLRIEIVKRTASDSHGRVTGKVLWIAFRTSNLSKIVKMTAETSFHCQTIYRSLNIALIKVALGVPAGLGLDMAVQFLLPVTSQQTAGCRERSFGNYMPYCSMACPRVRSMLPPSWQIAYFGYCGQAFLTCAALRCHKVSGSSGLPHLVP
jgi:hypothetical protein